MSYRLFALTTTPENIERLSNQRFMRATAGYILVYADEEQKNAVEISGKDVSRLTTMDKEWLLGCQLNLIYDDLKSKEPDMARQMSEQIEKLEEALAEQKELISKG